MEIIKLGNATGVLKQEDSISIQVPAANNAVRALHVHSADWMKLIEFFNGLSIMGEVVKAFCGPAGGGGGANGVVTTFKLTLRNNSHLNKGHTLEDNGRGLLFVLLFFSFQI